MKERCLFRDDEDHEYIVCVMELFVIKDVAIYCSCEIVNDYKCIRGYPISSWMPY